MKKLLNNPVFNNIFWLFLDKGYGALLTLYIYAKLATYFGTTTFGVWNYIISFASLLPAVASLGLNYIIIKRLKSNPLLSDKILSISFYLRLFTGTITAIILFITYTILNINFNSDLILVIILLFSSQIVMNSNIYIQKNEANLQNRKTVIARSISLTLFFILKLLAIQWALDIVYFALLTLLEYLLFFIIIKIKEDHKLKLPSTYIRKKITPSLLKEGLPLMLAAITTTLYLKIDQLFIASFTNNNDVGIYAASARISEFLYAIPVIVSNVFFPKIMKAFTKENIDKMLYQMFAIVLILAIICVLIISTFSDIIIEVMYGKEYIQASEILKIHAWSIILMSLLVTSSKYILKINRQDIIFKRELMGLTSNIILNFLLIPRYGIKGAAWATLISYSVSSFFSNFFFKETRPLIKKQFLSIYYILK
ncbi:flippase [uncultured Algibacter sp.]|uniref:flippase n=1 Tax=uncultured Algibacter sp. TaxID=298659 RepID=UPI0030EEBD48|tara:strand:- start:2688 stop:3962 length:1275 start_codon:yes stop_codon:yes gene_type:complete